MRDTRGVFVQERRLIQSSDLVRRLSDALAQVKDEQGYIVVRERVHRNTAESTNGRVKWWSIFQLAVVIGEGIFQVWWLKRFFEVSLCESIFQLSRWRERFETNMRYHEQVKRVV